MRPSILWLRHSTSTSRHYAIVEEEEESRKLRRLLPDGAHFFEPNCADTDYFAAQGRKVNIENVPTAHTEMEDMETRSVDSRVSTLLSELSEDNDIPIHTSENSLLAWLAQGKVALEEKLLQLKDKATARLQNRKRGRGSYKRDGETQALRTRQGKVKAKREAPEKAKQAGNGFLVDMWAKQREKAREKERLRELGVENTVEIEVEGSDKEETAKEGSPGISAPISSPAPSIPSPNSSTSQACVAIEDIEEGLDDLPDILPGPEPNPSSATTAEAAEQPTFMFIGAGPSRLATFGHFVPPPDPETVAKCIADLEELLRPKRASGRGYRDPGYDYTLRSRLELMLMFLRLYSGKGHQDWSGTALHIAKIAGKGTWLARRIHQWTQDYARDRKNLPTHLYGKWNSSILEDEDLAQELHLHLQGIGPYIAARDIVQYLAADEMKARLNLKKTISEQTARRWMHRMRYRWRREPKGQYKDGHEREDVVAYRQNVFLPTMQQLETKITDWSRAHHAGDQDFILCEAAPEPRIRAEVVIWTHDESTFYANDRRKLRWVHDDEDTKPYAKGEGASLMVADFISADYGWLKGHDG